MDLDREKMHHLTPRQVKMVEKIVGFLRYCDEKHQGEEDIEGFEGGGVLLGPPEAFYRTSKDWNKLP